MCAGAMRLSTTPSTRVRPIASTAFWTALSGVAPAPKVRIDQHEAAAIRLAERQREVDGGQRLALAGHGARDHHHPRAVLALGVMQQRGDAAVLLDRHRPHLVADDQLLAKAGRPY